MTKNTDCMINANYTVLSASCQDLLASRVNEYIEEGYMPVGGVSVAHNSLSEVDKDFGLPESRFYQAVMKNIF